MVEIRKLLEFDKVVSHLKLKTLCPVAADRFDTLPFLTQKSEIERALARVRELAEILEHDKPFPLQVWDIRADLSAAAVYGATLSPEALIRILNTLAAGRRVLGYLRERREVRPQLWAVVAPMQRCKELEKEIPAAIDPRTMEVKSSASPELGQIRKKIGRLEQKARKTLESLFRKYADLGYLQESVLSLKDGRLVFPVKRENKNRIPGLTHDLSATGSTVFVEPLESLQLNNEVQELRAEEKKEVERILRALTAKVHAERPALVINFEILAELDFIHAKALFAREFKCEPPSLNEGSNIAISGGRHPLLLMHKSKSTEIVPLNMSLPAAVKTLVITGPNAGGKSVALKTVGLFALMVQTGIPIPAAPDSTLPVFENIFADIGDFQSIENDLSTFSSHVQRIANILRQATARSLVLLDEIGAGTDPAEGSALSIALLEELTGRGCKTLVTTHHSNLKAFAFDTPGVENGSMEFESTTLAPTYRFKAGVPGSSYALEICDRLGLKKSLLQRSRVLLGEDKQRLENLILELDRKAQHAEELARDLEAERERLRQLTGRYEEKMASIKRFEKEARENALSEARELLAGSNAAVERAIKEIRENQASREAIAEARERLVEQRKKIDAVAQRADAETPEKREERPSLAAGVAVLWKKQRKSGKVLEAPAGANKVLVQFGDLKIWVRAEELSRATPEKQTPKTTSVRVSTSDKGTVLPEIDVRGMRVEEATDRVDKFLDDALLAGWERVRIIHGKGTGALRKGVLAFLEKHPRVRSADMAAWNEGDFGVTVVEL